jgi:hypothetical protein
LGGGEKWDLKNLGDGTKNGNFGLNAMYKIT